jgi:hypothetical protein
MRQTAINAEKVTDCWQKSAAAWIAMAREDCSISPHSLSLAALACRIWYLSSTQTFILSVELDYRIVLSTLTWGQGVKASDSGTNW